jgi:hypothetical protein
MDLSTGCDVHFINKAVLDGFAHGL